MEFSSARFFLWVFIALCLTVGAGLYWKSQGKYETKAGVVTNATPEIQNNTQTTGLVGHWTFDTADMNWGAANEVQDKTANNNDGDVGANIDKTNMTLGRIGQAISLNGVDESITVADNTALDITGSLTISVWIYPEDVVGYHSILSKKDGADENPRNYELMLSDLETPGLFFYASGGERSGEASESVLLNHWNHVVATYSDTANLILFYINGKKVYSEANAYSMVANDYALTIGSDVFKGKIDDVRLYNTVLTPDEVLRLYDSANMGVKVNTPVEDPLSQGLLGYWKLDEGTGTSTTADASGNATTLTMTAIDSGDWQTGRIGPWMLDLDGSAAWLTATDPDILDFSDGKTFTLTGWFNRDTFTTEDIIVAKANDSSSVGYMVSVTADDKLAFFVHDGSDPYSVYTYFADFAASGWRHFAAVWGDTSAALYIDGAPALIEPTGTIGDIGSLVNTLDFKIGAASNNDYPFDGKLDDIRVYGYPLSSGDVLKLYQTTAPAQPVDTGLVGHWTFDGPDIQNLTAVDRSGKGNHGTMTGTTKTIGKLGQGLSFNGTSDYVRVPYVSNLNLPTVVSLSAWIKIRTLSTFGGIVGRFDNYIFQLSEDNPYDELQFTLYSTTWRFAKTTNLNLQTNTWYHVAAVFDETTDVVYFYANGVLAGSPSFTYNMPDSSVFDVTIGSANDGVGDYFDGVIDDVRIYNRALSAAEVANLYSIGR